MLQLKDVTPVPTIVPSDRETGAGSSEEGLRRIWLALRRDLRLIFAIFALVVAATTAVLVVLPQSYTATTTLLIDPRAAGVFNNQYQFQIGPSDPAILDSQVEILKSDHLALLVIANLDLANDPEFNSDRGLLGPVADLVPSWLKFGAAPSETRRLQTVLRAFQKRLDVQRSQQTFIVDVSFRSNNPEKAARVANGIADAYFRDRLQARFNATKLAGTWLNDRIKELREAAIVADSRVEAYKKANNIVVTGDILINEKELSDVNTQLAQARATTSEAEARYARIREVVDSGNVNSDMTADVANNAIIQKLRADHGELVKREGFLARRTNAKHAALVQVREQIDEVRQLILEEYARVADSIRNNLEVARSREKAIADRMRSLTDVTTDTNQAQVQLRDLLREAISARTVYESFLQRSKEMTQQESLPVTETRVVTAAIPPLLPSHPKSLLILALAAGAGLAVGIGGALARDRFDPTLHSAPELEKIAGAECLGMVPFMVWNDRSTFAGRRRMAAALSAAARPAPLSQRSLPAEQGQLSFVVSQPFSHFAETMRAIKVAAKSRSLSQDSHVIAITSALPREGKTTIAANFAQHLASTGYRTLLIDADLRNRALSRQLAPGAHAGLTEAVMKTVPLERLQYVDGRTGLSFLPAALNGNTASNTDEILGCDGFRTFLQSAASSYDFVVLDGPPILPIVDLRAMLAAVDWLVYVVEWGHTPRSAIERATHISDLFQEKLLGAVLNKVRIDLIDYYGGSYGARYEAYGYGQKVIETR